MPSQVNISDISSSWMLATVYMENEIMYTALG